MYFSCLRPNVFQRALQELAVCPWCGIQLRPHRVFSESLRVDVFASLDCIWYPQQLALGYKQNPPGIVFKTALVVTGDFYPEQLKIVSYFVFEYLGAGYFCFFSRYKVFVCLFSGLVKVVMFGKYIYIPVMNILRDKDHIHEIKQDSMKRDIQGLKKYSQKLKYERKIY